MLILKYTKKLNYRKKIIYERSSTIPKCFNKIIFKIYKGNLFRSLKINVYNVGRKFGEFSFTRKPFHFPIKKKKR